MKKIVILALAAAALLSSCNRDEIVEQNQNNSISFETPFVDQSTKAVDATMGNLSRFYVHGYMINAQNEYVSLFVNQLVEKKASGKWEYTPPKYWIEGNKYYFTALNVNSVPGGALEYTDHNNGTFLLKVNNKELNAEQDVIFATAKAENVTAGAQAPVGFTFRHLLSRMKFSFTNGLSEDYTVKIKGATICETPEKAEFVNLGDDPMMGASFRFLNYNIPFTAFTQADGGIAANATAPSEAKYVLVNNTERTLPVDFTFDVLLDGKVVLPDKKITSTITGTFLIGHSYNITAEITDTVLNLNQIEFNVIEVTDWVTEPDIPIA